MDGNAVSRQSQVVEEKTIIGKLMTELSEEICKLEQRLQSCLRQEPSGGIGLEKKENSTKVELADWLSTHGKDIQRQIYQVRGIIEKCEL